MNQSQQLSHEEIVRARQFHLHHFPNQNVPTAKLDQPQMDEVLADTRSNDLGFYEDGTRRTLTDEQVAMFRHSEIQRLLAERRHRREAEEEKKAKRDKSRRVENTRGLPELSAPSRYDDDSKVHARNDTHELSYEDSSVQPIKEKAKTFQWPLLES